MSAKTVVIIHRKSADREVVKEAVRFAKAKGCKFRVLVPFNKKEKGRIIREMILQGARRVIAGGGDGTINATANALMGLQQEGHKVEMGVLPLGTANDFARGLNLPVDDLGECLRTACTGTAAAIDVGRMNDRFFVNVASLGFGSEVTATTPAALKKALGGAAYSIAGIVKALQIKPYSCELHVPGEEVVKGDMLFMAVGNNRYAGGGFDVSPLAKLDDGFLDLAAITVSQGFSILRLQEELNEIANPSNRFIRYRQLQEFTLKSDRDLYCNLDGEPFKSNIFRFSVVPKSLKLVLQRS